MSKESGAFLTIGELSAELDVPQHILRYWETRFPALRPLQRAGNRRYYRAEDVALARRIHRLLNVEGYTVRGAQQALSGKGAVISEGQAEEVSIAEVPAPFPAQPSESGVLLSHDERAEILTRLKSIRAKLAQALAETL